MKEFKDAGGELLEADSDFDAENDFLQRKDLDLVFEGRRTER